MRRLPVLLILCAVLLLPATALAHAVLLAAEPADGSRLAAAPRTLLLQFSEPVSLLSLSLAGPQGLVTLDLATAEVTDSRVGLKLDRALPAGGYLLNWRVVSLDGHVVQGSLGFAIGTGAVPTADTTPSADWLRLTAHGLATLGLLVGLGAAAWIRRLAIPGLITVARSTLTLAFFAALTGLAAVGGLASGASPLSPQAWLVGLVQAAGLAALLLALAAAAATLAPADGPRRLFLPLAVGLALTGYAWTGHAAASPWLGRLAMVLHLAAVLAWIGSLLPLLLALLGGRSALVFPLFQRWIVPVLLLLAGSGLFLALQELDYELPALWTTPYGRLLALKLLLVAALLALGAGNRWRLVPAFARGRPRAKRHLAISLAAEVLLAAAIVGVTTTLGSLPPPRNLAHACRVEAVTTTLAAQDTRAELRLRPGCAGMPVADVMLRNVAGEALAPLQVSLRLARPEIPGRVVVLQPQAPGHYQGEVGWLPLAGSWDAELILLVDDFHRATLRGAIELAEP